MSHEYETIEFVNRTDELEELRQRVYPSAQAGTCTFLRSPSGFGKSRLTDQLLDEQKQIDAPTYIVVDPSIRSKRRSGRIYAWFFVQRAAEPEARRSLPSQPSFPSFAEFLRTRQLVKLNWKEVYEHAKGATSIGGLIKGGVELSENIFKFGKFSPETLLQDDSKYACDVAQAYVNALAKDRPIVFVIREANNIDAESLRFFLSLVDTAPCCALIFEYTTASYSFSAEHEKIIYDVISPGTRLTIFDLVKLNLKEFRYLLRKYVAESKKIEASAELEWDGNLRILRELKYRVMVGGTVLPKGGLDLVAATHKNLAALSSRQRLILSLVVAHVEAIDLEILSNALRRIDANFASSLINEEVRNMEEQRDYLRVTGSSVSLADEDLIDAISSSPVMQSPLKLAIVTLRDLYLEVVGGKEFCTISFQSSLRQAVALCAKSGDIFALRNLIGHLETESCLAFNQALYVGIIADVALSRHDLSELEIRDLCGWAAAAAYDSGNPALAAQLAARLSDMRPYDSALLACCYGEINKHDEAYELGRRLVSGNAPSSSAALAGYLIELCSLYALRRKQDATAVYAYLRNNPDFETSALYGYVLRFTELILNRPESTPDILASIAMFQRVGLHKSAAYSQLAGAMHVARSGDIDTARQLVAEATESIRPYLHDQALIDNNSTVVELMASEPPLAECINRLNSALITAADDFSRLTIRNNLLISYAEAGDQVRAMHQIEAIDRILTNPRFGNRDIFVSVSYNVWRFLSDIGEPDAAARYRDLALSIGLEITGNGDYWSMRFGLAEECAAKFEFLLTHRFHPSYLSHWLIDLDGLDVLKGEPAQ
jgi:hypothetical protein